jgi:hypothetical protein
VRHISEDEDVRWDRCAAEAALKSSNEKSNSRQCVTNPAGRDQGTDARLCCGLENCLWKRVEKFEPYINWFRLLVMASASSTTTDPNLSDGQKGISSKKMIIKPDIHRSLSGSQKCREVIRRRVARSQVEEIESNDIYVRLKSIEIFELLAKARTDVVLPVIWFGN